jgi:universal stress protein A
MREASMITLHRILMATDFSDDSKEALDDAVLLTRSLRATLYLLHVFEPPFYSPTRVAIGIRPEVVQWVQDLRTEESKRLDLLTDEVRRQDAKVHSISEEGTPFLEILTAAGELPADLIVLGTHGRTGLSHFLMGRVAERVVRKAPCPVLTVRPKALQAI